MYRCLKIMTFPSDQAAHVDAAITVDGDVRMTRNCFGPGETATEQGASVHAADKTRLLAVLKMTDELPVGQDEQDSEILIMLKEYFCHDKDPVESFRNLAELNGILVDELHC